MKPAVPPRSRSPGLLAWLTPLSWQVWPTSVDGYEIYAPIGRGAYAIVYRAKVKADVKSAAAGRPVAIKVRPVRRPRRVPTCPSRCWTWRPSTPRGTRSARK